MQEPLLGTRDEALDGPFVGERAVAPGDGSPPSRPPAPAAPPRVAAVDEPPPRDGDDRLRLSYSSISTYELCPLKWRFQYQDRLPTARTPALAFGESLHEALRWFHAQPVPEPPPLEALLAYLDECWISEGYAGDEEESAYRAHGREVLAAYHRGAIRDYRIPVALEQRFELAIDDVLVVGVIDRMDRHPDGTYEIIDYKTNRRLPPRRRLAADLQLSLYALAARELWGIWPGRLTFHFLLPGQRFTTRRGPEDAEATRERIRAAARGVAAGRFPPVENPLCGWCDFRDRCPLWAREGAPPEADAGRLLAEWVDAKRAHRDAARRLEALSGRLHDVFEREGVPRLFTDGGAQVTRVRRPDGAHDLTLRDPR